MVSNLLIITESMMPFTSNWGACQRIYHYAKKMVSEGLKVTVICHNTSGRVDSTENVEGITVIGHGGRKVPTASGVQPSGGFKADLRKKLQAIDRNVKVVSKIVRSTYRFLYSEPNALSGRTAKNWANAVMPFALDYIYKEHIDAVIISGPTFGLFYHADEIKAKGVKLILDYRDPWVSWYEKPTLASKAERKAIECADLVVTTTETLTEALNKKYKSDKCQTVMNGYDKDLWSTIVLPEHDPSRFIISYVGNIKIHGQPGFRDSTCFMAAAKKFKERHPETIIQFVGVKDDIDEINPKLKEYVEFRNTVPVAESLEITARADVLLMFHTALDPSGKYIICGKAFDCLRSGNYVLSIGDVAYANKEIVERTGCGMHCDNNEEAILSALETIFAKWKEGNLIDRNRDTEIYSRDYQNTEFLRLIRAL